jgi:hypothetical protein
MPVRIGIGAASAVAVSKSPPAASGSLTTGSAVPGASSRDQVASGSDGLPFWVVILLALILVCAGGLGVRHWDRRRKQRSLETNLRRLQANWLAYVRRIELERAKTEDLQGESDAGGGTRSPTRGL